MKAIAHVTELLGFTPVHEALTSYVVGQFVSVPFCSMLFRKVNVSFGNDEAKYLFQHHDLDSDELDEFWLVYDGHTPSAIAQRKFVGGTLMVDSFDFTQYQRQPYQRDFVTSMISELPEL